jgi:NADH-quinone oxidoreductase subunit J
MTNNQFMFLLFSVVIVIFSLLTVTSRKILRAATYLLFVLVSTSGLYFLLRFNFLAAIQLTLYAGGIVVLIIFSILLTSQINDKLSMPAVTKRIYAAIAAAAGAIVCIMTILQTEFVQKAFDPARVHIKTIGEAMLSTGKYGYALPFEVISVLLLAAMIGSIILAKKRKD